MNSHPAEAFSFECPLDHMAIRAKFQAVGTYAWVAPDSDTPDLCLRGKPASPGWPAKLQVYHKNKNEYLIEFCYYYDELTKGATVDHVVAFVLDNLLPAIKATNVKSAKAVS